MKHIKLSKLFMLLPIAIGASLGKNQIIYYDAFEDKTIFKRNINVNKTQKVKNVIMFIGDGMGYNHVNAGSLFKGSPLCFADESNKDWTYHALVNTDSLTSKGFYLDESKSLIHPDENGTLYDATPSPYGTVISFNDNTPYTDSAAGGTALATGHKTINGRIGKDFRGKDYENISEIAHKLGKKVGVISTDELTGATPSAYLAHVDSRYQADYILNGDKTGVADLIIAKKPGNWSSSYESSFKSEGKYDNIVYDIDGLDSTKNKQLLLHDGCSPLYGYKNTLANEVAYALDYLDNSDDGFFLVVEGANIDKKAHSNDLLGFLEELMGFDQAVETAMEWASGRDDTIMCVSADHETGGFYYDYSATTQDEMMNTAGFKSTNHSRSRVRLDVYGDISEFTNKYQDEFSELENKPYWDNTWIFNLCCSYL